MLKNYKLHLLFIFLGVLFLWIKFVQIGDFYETTVEREKIELPLVRTEK